MKKLVFVSSVIVFLIGFVACDAIEKLTQFNMSIDSDITIPRTLGVDLPITVFTPDINMESESEFDSNNTHKDLIEDIYPTEITLTITSPESASFDFLKNIEITISAEGMSEKKIAWLDDIPKSDLKVITLEVSSSNLKEYILKDSFKLNTNTTTRELISEDIEVTIHTVFFVDAKVLGV
jgi:hypothetical protein